MTIGLLSQRTAIPATAQQWTERPTIVLFGDSRTDDCGVGFNDLSAQTLAALNDYTTNIDWFGWGQAALSNGPVFDVIRNSGIGGNTTTQMLNRIGQDVLAYKPSHMTLWGGTNDSWTQWGDVDASFARMVQMMQIARRAGIYVFLISETMASTKGTTFNAWVQYYNDKLRTYAAATPGIEYWDFNSLFTNPAVTTGYPIGAMTRDGVHLTPYASAVIGQKIVGPHLARWAPNTPAELVATPLDSMSQSGYVRNALSNPLMGVTTGGTVPTGDSGQLPDGWTSTTGQAATAVYSTPARADGIGNDLKAVYTSTTSGSKYTSSTLTSSRLVPGATYVLEGSVSLASPTLLFALALYLQISTSAGTYQRGVGFNEQPNSSTDNLSAFTGVFRSRKFVMPASITGATLQLLTRFSATGGAATVTLGRVSLKRVD